MKVKKINPQIKYVEKIRQLKHNMAMSALLGDCNGFKNAKIELAKESLKNFEVAKKVKGTEVSVPLFSKYGFNMLKVRICNFFRIKTPEEKLYRQRCVEDLSKLQSKFDTQI